MQRRTTPLQLCGVTAAAFLLASCTATREMKTAAEFATATPAAALEKIYEEYFEAQLRLSPLSATFIGDERYNNQLENTASIEWRRDSERIEREFLARAVTIAPQQLSSPARISYEVFVAERQRSIAGYQFPERLLPIDQMNSMASTFAVLGSGASAQPFRNRKDYEDFLQRCAGFVAWSNSAIDAMRAGMKAGVLQPRVVMQKVVPQLRELGTASVEESVFWQPVKGMPESIAGADRSRLTAAYRATLTNAVLPAYRRLADFVEQEYLPKARSSVAWAALPDGAAWYNYRIAGSTTTALTAEQIHELGLLEVARILSEMNQVRVQVGFQGDLQAFFAHLRTDPQFFFDNPAQLLAGYQALKLRIDSLLPKMFADFPKADYQVREVEPFRARSAPGASYQRPSADGKRPGYFYINTYNLKAQPRYGMETLSLHEAAPGHHFQISIQQELTDLPRFRRFGGYTAYAEGWALYCESIGKELGLFTDPYQWFGRLNDEMLRAMRLVVDTGLHSKGWTRERAIRYMVENSSLAESDVEAEVERYIVWPAQALSYKVGQLRITAMRAKAQAALGENFDIKAFHSQLLRDGSLPMAVLEAKIDRWIAAVKTR